MNDAIAILFRIVGVMLGVLFVTVPLAIGWWEVTDKVSQAIRELDIVFGMKFIILVIAVFGSMFLTIMLNLIFWKFFIQYGNMLADKFDKVFADG